MGLDFCFDDCECAECADFRRWADERLAKSKLHLGPVPTVVITDDDSDFSYERAEARAVEEVKVEKMERNQMRLEMLPTDLMVAIPTVEQLEQMLAL